MAKTLVSFFLVLDKLMHEVMSEKHNSDSDSVSDPSDSEEDSDDTSSKSEVSEAEEKENKSPTKSDKVEEVTLDEESREALGEVPFAESENEVILNKDLIDRWKYWIEKGMKKEEKDKLKLQYKYKGTNCLLLAPKLNPEVSAALSPTARTRDKYFMSSQECLAAATTALGQGLTVLLRNKGPEDRPAILQNLADAGKLLTDLLYQSSKSRRAYIVPAMDAMFKEVLEESKPDSMLFGADLNQKMKAAKSYAKSGKELQGQKNHPSAKKAFKKQSSGNYRGQSSRGRARQGHKSRDSQWSSDQSKPKKDQNKPKFDKK